MKFWQKIELTGSFFVLFSLLFQFFVTTSIENNLNKTNDLAIEMRLNHLYHLIKTGKENKPNWSEIDASLGKQIIQGDNRLSFQEVYDFLKPIIGIFFLFGSTLMLFGKYLEYKERNAA